MSSNSLEVFGKCKKKDCGCQIFRLNTDSDEQCYFCSHKSGFHEIISEIDVSKYTLGPCNKDKACECQRFKNKESDTEKCIYCDHFFAFHESWIQYQHSHPTISTSSSSNANPATLLSQMQNNVNNNNLITNRFTSARQELLANFRPSLTVSFNDIQRPRNNRANNQRHRNVQRNIQNQQNTKELKLSYIILMNKVSSSTIPKVASSIWDHLSDHGFIKQNIILSENNINHQIHELFPMLINQNWKIFNPSSGKLKDVENMVTIFKIFFF
jgi:hypothetical protein